MAGAKLRQCSDCLKKGKNLQKMLGHVLSLINSRSPFFFFFLSFFFFPPLLNSLGRIFIVCQKRLWFSGLQAIGERQHTQKS